MRRRAQGAIAIGAVTGLGLLLVYWPLLAGGVVHGGDAFSMDHPARVYLSRRLTAGELPLWYPFDGLGVPFVESMVTSTFHPFTLLHLAIGTRAGHTLAILVAAAFAISGAYLLGRRQGLKSAALLPAIGFGMGGALASAVEHLQFFSGAAAFPWFLLGMSSAFTGPGHRKGLVIAAAALASAILVGDLQAAYLYVLLGLPLTITMSGGPPTLPRIGWTVGAVLLGCGLAAAQLLPTVLIAPVTDRIGGIEWEVASRWSVHPLQIAEVFLGAWLPHAPTSAATMQVFGQTRAPWLLSIGVGTLAGLGALWAIVLPAAPAQRRQRVAIGLAAAALLWAATGRYGGLYGILYSVLPGWDLFRYPAKLMPYASLLLALLAGHGVSASIRHKLRAVRTAAWASGTLALSALGGWLVTRLWSTGPELLLVHLETLPATLLAGALLLAVMALVLTLVARRQRSPGWVIPGAAGVLLLLQIVPESSRAVDLLSTRAPVFESQSPFAHLLHERFGPPLGRYRVASVFSRSAPPTETLLELNQWKRVALVDDIGGLFGIETYFPYLPANPGHYRERLRGRVGEWVAQEGPLYNIRFVVMDGKLLTQSGWPQEELQAYLPDVNLHLLSFPASRVRPRAYLARPLVTDPIEDVASFRFSPDVLDGTVAIVDGGVGVAADPGPGPGPGPGTSSVEITRYEYERVLIAVRNDTGGPRVLVLNDAFYPGWRAFINGKRVEIHRANLLVRGVMIPPGSHEVRFEYPLPARILVGLVITASSLLSAVLILLVPAVKRRSTP